MSISLSSTSTTDTRAGNGSPTLDRVELFGDCTEHIDRSSSTGLRRRIAVFLAHLRNRCHIEPRTRRMLTVVLASLAVITTISAWATWPREEPASLAVAVSQTEDAGATTLPITVTVAGDVTEPGLVELSSGARVADAIDAAGGLIPEARSAGYVNLARKVSDGELIVVEAVTDPEEPTDPDEPTDPVDTPGTPTGPGAPVNLNQATVTDLVALPGIGPVMAQRIIDHRQANGGFDSVDQLQDVTGIGPATAAKLADLVTV
ncbi:helix-hairpin-helix domain-containing protein [Stackebrandtia endophytica]|nr:helix-hairpin-helix domain-containing protein [Stackebrandtia endophytica]